MSSIILSMPTRSVWSHWLSKATLMMMASVAQSARLRVDQPRPTATTIAALSGSVVDPEPFSDGEGGIYATALGYDNCPDTQCSEGLRCDTCTDDKCCGNISCTPGAGVCCCPRPPPPPPAPPAPPTPPTPPSPTPPAGSNCSAILKTSCPLATFKRYESCLKCAKENAKSPICSRSARRDYCRSIKATPPQEGNIAGFAAAPGAIDCIQMLSNGAGVGWALKATLGAFCPGIVKALNGLAKLSGDEALFCLDFHDALGPESINGCLGASVGMNALGKFNDSSHMICDDLGLLVFREQAYCNAGAATFNAMLPTS